MANGRGFSRRRFLIGSASATAAASLGGWTPRMWAQATDRTLRVAVDPTGTTLASTIIPTGTGPYRTTTDGPGEPSLVRTELAAPAAGREDRRTPLAAFAHFTDQHLTDAQSPGRVEFLDPAHSLFQAAFRPQELLTTQVATSMVDRVNQLGAGPVSGRAFDCVVCTGDNIDNQQINEMQWFVDIMDGGTITPDSGQIGTYQGPQDAELVDAKYWHPDAGISDSYKTDLGYPDVPGLLARSIAPFTSPGVNVPWYSVYGNHDCNVQGNAARSDALDTIFTGSRKMTAVKPGEDPFGFILRVMFDSPGVLADLQAGVLPHRDVTADPARRTATIDDWIDAHLSSPTGDHGYAAADLAAGRLYYEFQVAPGVVGISLDTTNHNGGPNGADGNIGAEQLRWLEERLAAHHARYFAPDGSLVTNSGQDQLVIIFSHHTAGSMNVNEPDPAHPTERRVLGPEVVATLVRYPNVVAWVNGHTHTNNVTPRPHPTGLTDGFWEICTASHVDSPQQARLIELVDNHDGTISIFGTLIEHVASATVDREAADRVGLSGLARELGLNDAQADPLNRAGSPEDRNVELVLRAPFVIPVVETTTTTSTTTPSSTTTSPSSSSTSTSAPRTATTSTSTSTSTTVPGGSGSTSTSTTSTTRATDVSSWNGGYPTSPGAVPVSGSPNYTG